MTPSRRAAETANKRAERLRRKEAGEVRCELWLDQDTLLKLDLFASSQSVGRSAAVEILIANAPRW
jgi:hypothetical protein